MLTCFADSLKLNFTSIEIEPVLPPGIVGRGFPGTHAWAAMLVNSISPIRYLPPVLRPSRIDRNASWY